MRVSLLAKSQLIPNMLPLGDQVFCYYSRLHHGFLKRQKWLLFCFLLFFCLKMHLESSVDDVLMIRVEWHCRHRVWIWVFTLSSSSGCCSRMSFLVNDKKGVSIFLARPRSFWGSFFKYSLTTAGRKKKDSWKILWLKKIRLRWYFHAYNHQVNCDFWHLFMDSGPGFWSEADVF